MDPEQEEVGEVEEVEQEKEESTLISSPLAVAFARSTYRWQVGPAVNY